MNRNQFFTVLGVTAGTVIFAPFLTSCSKSSSLPTDTIPVGGSGAVDFTLDLTLPANAPLNINGGSILKSGVIIAKTSTGSYVAVASVCTHEGATIQFNGANTQFNCPNHGSNFATTGAVINGPATTALKMYNTSLSGTSLRVFG